MKHDFPERKNAYLKAEDFQDNETTLTYLGYDEKPNEDDPKGQKGGRTWKEKLKYQLRYSYPQMAVDEAGEQRVGKDGEPFQNRHWNPEYPHGYSIVYHFDEGDLESGSLPLFDQFCIRRPKSGEKVAILRTGKDKETKWSLRVLGRTQSDVREIQLDRTPDQLDSVDLDRTPF